MPAEELEIQKIFISIEREGERERGAEKKT